jgi:hypothetical protein
MILNTITAKNLALYGILDTYNNYTIDKDNLMVTASVQIAYNLSDIQETISQTESLLNSVDEEEGYSDEIKEKIKEDYQETLEILNLIKDKLN